jgi:toxin ParE1/3/4
VRKCILLDAADDDLSDAFNYIARDSLDAAKRFLDAVRQDAQRLTEMPGIGALRDFARPDLKDVRSWPVSGFRNFLIFYRPIDDGIEVIRVVHGARDLDRLFRS